MKIYKMLVEEISNGIAGAAMKTKGPRVVILHNHIFKNAGSTIDWVLKKNFSEAFVDHRDNQLMKQGARYLEQYLQANKHIKALSSHHLTMPLPEIENFRLLQMVMLRHPIERVTSVYNFERSHEVDITPGVIHAKKYCLRDYILWRMKPDVGATIRNFHVRKMLPHRKVGQDAISDEEMAKAKTELSKRAMFGLVERFDESMVCFEEELKKHIPSVDLSYVAQNVGQSIGEPFKERVERLINEIGQETYEILVQNNQADLELFEWAKMEFEKKVAATPYFHEKLSNFRLRCKKI